MTQQHEWPLSFNEISAPDGRPLLVLLFLIGTACWCWLGRGPRFLRWFPVIGIVLILSGHPLGRELTDVIAPLAGPLFALWLIWLAFRIMLRGFGRHPYRGYCGCPNCRSYDRRYRTGRRWHDDRW